MATSKNVKRLARAKQVEKDCAYTQALRFLAEEGKIEQVTTAAGTEWRVVPGVRTKTETETEKEKESDDDP